MAERAAAPSEVYILDAMPLTAIGKVNKRVLRVDAAKRHFEGALSHSGADLNIEVEERAATGITLVVTITGGDGDKIKAGLEDILRPYAMAHEVRK